MRLGAQIPATWSRQYGAEIYGKDEISERHRHRYEINNNYLEHCRAPACVSPAGRLTVRWSK